MAKEKGTCFMGTLETLGIKEYNNYKEMTVTLCNYLSCFVFSWIDLVHFRPGQVSSVPKGFNQSI
jgi:hypothetical protein